MYKNKQNVIHCPVHGCGWEGRIFAANPHSAFFYQFGLDIEPPFA